jgi:hypothetical protein
MNELKLKTIIAEAMYAGSLLGEKNFGGVINSKEFELYVASLAKLEALLKEFVTESGLNDINVEKVLPILKEIQTVTKPN